MLSAYPKFCLALERESGERGAKVIKAVMAVNTRGKPRLAKYHDLINLFNSFAIIDVALNSVKSASGEAAGAYRKRFAVLCSRAENVSNFIEAESVFGPDSCLVYKHFVTLYFVLVFDSSENELAELDLIQGSDFKHYLMAGKASYALLGTVCLWNMPSYDIIITP
ncbi:Clathrin adaptor complex small chain family protein [Theobroma cacao]|uniref:Clathrin adaptor complex small chain family protein n=1 Tax=Theobroma cacao TaxID=3641 RepID=A0A061DF07_THECC|nr:Clathrin adaptor complex small chain family protein [Theobroma cacao]